MRIVTLELFKINTKKQNIQLLRVSHKTTTTDCWFTLRKEGVFSSNYTNTCHWYKVKWLWRKKTTGQILWFIVAKHSSDLKHLSQFTFIFVCVKIVPIDFDRCNPLSGTNMLQFFGHCHLSMCSERILNFILLVKKAQVNSNVWSNAQQIFTMKIFHFFKPSLFVLTKKVKWLWKFGYVMIKWSQKWVHFTELLLCILCFGFDHDVAIFTCLK